MQGARLIGKDPDAGKDRGQEEKWVTEDEMVGWHHQLNGREFERALGDSEGRGSLVCCGPWVTESGTTEPLSDDCVPYAVLRSLREFLKSSQKDGCSDYGYS